MSASSGTQQISSSNGWNFLQRYLTGRRGLIVAAVALAALGLYLGWGWLVAAGAAPILVAFAPCAAMCALGLCMNKMGGQSCSNKSETKGDADAKNS